MCLCLWWVCVYKQIYIYIYIYIYVYIYIYIYTYVFSEGDPAFRQTWPLEASPTSVYMYIYIYMITCIMQVLYTCIHIYIYIYICTYNVCVYVCDGCVYINKYIYTYIYIYIRSISEISSCLFGPRPWRIEIRHRVKKKTSTVNLFGFETLKLKIRRLKLWKPTASWTTILWYAMICYDALWCTMIYCNILWYTIINYHTL